MVDAWVLATDTTRLAAMVDVGRGLGGRVTVAAVGPRWLAEAAAGAGPDAVAWIETADGVPAEAYAGELARAVAAAAPPAVLAASAPSGRALLGATAAALGAPVIAGVLRLAADGGGLVVRRADLGGRVTETLATTCPFAGLFGGDDIATPAPSAGAAPIGRLEGITPADLRITRTEPLSGATGGVTTAARVVSVGRGLKSRADLALIDDLAAALGAEVGCSMPIADDFGWVAKERYVGRSGQQIAPRLYLAIGISGMPQHLEGVRDAKVVVGINTDPGARIFERAAYGIVGDLYEVVPALQHALGK